MSRTGFEPRTFVYEKQFLGHIKVIGKDFEKRREPHISQLVYICRLHFRIDVNWHFQNNFADLVFCSLLKWIYEILSWIKFDFWLNFQQRNFGIYLISFCEE